jgi:hypothetical protein
MKMPRARAIEPHPIHFLQTPTIHLFRQAIPLLAALLLSTSISHAGQTISRSITFDVTFAQQDLTWLGDPASPLSTASIKNGAQPLATDLVVRTLTESTEPILRRYYPEARLQMIDGQLTLFAFTPKKEKIIGTVTPAGRFLPNDFYLKNHSLLPGWPEDPATLRYQAGDIALHKEVHLPGRHASESLDFLPLNLTQPTGQRASGTCTILFSPSAADQPAQLHLVLHADNGPITLATATLPRWLPRPVGSLGSFNNVAGTYFPESAYRQTPVPSGSDLPTVTFQVTGSFSAAVHTDQPTLTLAMPITSKPSSKPAAIVVDGNFDDWRNIEGVDDPRGDTVSYLDYLPDVDILEFKAASDDAHVYYYIRVAGQVGRTHPQGGRSYFYAYMDVDQNPKTGFLPSRDDECYFGVDIGDDAEVQFEFVNNALRKTFYGFCGKGGNDQVLKQQVTLGPSQYGRLDDQGRERADYKAEYIYTGGKTEITEDLKLGTSDSIRLALSPDGSEVEVVSSLTGFLKSPTGKPTVAPGQTIDVAAGMEGDCKLYPGKNSWGADNTRPIRDFRVGPSTGR